MTIYMAMKSETRLKEALAATRLRAGMEMTLFWVAQVMTF